METLTKMWTIANMGITNYMYQCGMSALLTILVISGVIINVLLLLGYLHYVTRKL